MSLTEMDLKLFGFQLGHVLQIKRFKEALRAGNMVGILLFYHQSTTMISFSDVLFACCLLKFAQFAGPPSDETPANEEIPDSDLLEYMTQSELNELDDYEKSSIKERVANYKRLVASGKSDLLFLNSLLWLESSTY